MSRKQGDLCIKKYVFDRTDMDMVPSDVLRRLLETYKGYPGIAQDLAALLDKHEQEEAHAS